VFALGLTVFGGSFGAAEVAINVEGAAVEREMNKTVLPMMHGFYSLGTLAGAGVGMALTAFGIAANLHIVLAALVCIVPILTGIRAIPDGTGKNSADEQKSAERAAILPRHAADADWRGGAGDGLCRRLRQRLAAAADGGRPRL
jgi:hypothetical protein